MNETMSPTFVENQKKIILGTANFLTNYGIYAKNEKNSKQLSYQIIESILDEKTILVDTSAAYGEIEKFIGANFGNKLNNRIIAKLTIMRDYNEKDIARLIQETFLRLNQEQIYAIQIHNPHALIEPGLNSRIIKVISKYQEKNLVGRIGISAYSAAEIIEIKKLRPEFRSFQLPGNVCDRGNYKNKELIKLSREENEIFVRSIFLQGLILANPDELPSNLIGSKEIIIEIEEYCQSKGISRLEYCLDYASSIEWANGIIIGINSIKNLQTILRHLSKPTMKHEFSTPNFDNFISDPRNWSSNEKV